MQILRTGLFAAAAMTVLCAGVRAQEYHLQEINFDMWCQEEQHLPADRCDKRLPQDDADYQAYVAKIEKYEVPYLQRKQDEADFERTIIHNDPIDHPTIMSAPQVNQTNPPVSASPY